MGNIIEEGDIYFFYRNNVDVDQAKSVDDIRRFYLIMIPEMASRGRLFLVGKKRMPEIVSGESQAGEREWMINHLVDSPLNIGQQLSSQEYDTATQGKQRTDAAIPAGEGRYVLALHEDGALLAYKLVNPKSPGEAQKELGILSEAVYLLSVRNPYIDVPDKKPDYPEDLRERFVTESWLNFKDSQLLDYEYAQMVLIGHKKSLAEVGLKIRGMSDLFGKLGLNKEKWPTETLFSGEFTSSTHEVEVA